MIVRTDLSARSKWTPRAVAAATTRFASAARPFVDWANYWAAGDARSMSPESAVFGSHLGRNGRGVDGAVIDLEYQRIELIKFNLFANDGTYQDYLSGRDGIAGPGLKVWDAMRLPKEHPSYETVGGAAEQLCRGELIRFRNLDGICNDLRNPLMGASESALRQKCPIRIDVPGSRQEPAGSKSTPRSAAAAETRSTGDQPQAFHPRAIASGKCNEGNGLPGYSVEADCDYKKAPALNVLAAFWIQFMTHDWFSHLQDGHNQAEMMAVGCASQRIGNIEEPLAEETIAKLRCRPGDRIDRAYIAEDADPEVFDAQGQQHLARAYKTTRNTVTAWWDASQLYGYDQASRRRVKRDATDSAKLLLES